VVEKGTGKADPIVFIRAALENYGPKVEFRDDPRWNRRSVVQYVSGFFSCGFFIPFSDYNTMGVIKKTLLKNPLKQISIVGGSGGSGESRQHCRGERGAHQKMKFTPAYDASKSHPSNPLYFSRTLLA
jgi:hypothetical protein